GSWTLQLLDDMSIELKIIDPVTDPSVTRTARKMGLRPRLKDRWAIPSECDAAFVAGIEDILSVYARPLDPNYPVVCMDEKLFRPMKVASRPFNHDRVKYGQRIRHNAIFAFTEPSTGWHRTSVLERRSRDDWANQVRQLLEEDYPDARKVCLVMDKLNTHNIAALYRAFPAEKAFQLASRLEIHYAPKFGGWLNVAEIEMSVMERHCLGKYIPDAKALAHELSPWSTGGNGVVKAVRWQFANDQARRRLKHLYPEIND
ncbi:MAG: transposase, partial [Oscillospiraceae bacterium]|nr:transposase [Oscillospiraceae bacterium]